MKKGMFFTVDAVLGITILLLSLVLLSSFSIVERDSPAIQHASRDIVKVFTYAKVNEIDNAYVQALIANGTIDKPNNTVFEQVGEFWATGRPELASSFIDNVTGSLIPKRFGYSVLVNGEVITSNNKSVDTSLVSSKKIITGIERDKPTQGFTSRSYLSSLSNKRFSSYGYFGGFVGQGNISLFIEDIPATASLTSMYMELDAGGKFNLFINGVQCGGEYTETVLPFEADAYNISACLGSLSLGAKNNFTISFTEGISKAYVGGGFIRIDYLTDQFQPDAGSNTVRKRLPGISGIINLYDSFYVPGIIENMSVYVHYDALDQNSSGSTLYVTIGNTTVLLMPNVTSEQNVSLNDTLLESLLNYTELSEITVPIRVGFENVSYSFIFEGDADVMLITDVSGSMSWEMASGAGGTLRECNHASYNDTSTARISVAKCLDRQFAKDIVNVTGNKIGLVSFDGSTNSDTVSPTTNLTVINNTIGHSVPYTGYTAGGSTCVCCGINSARDTLVNSLNTQTLISSGTSWSYTTDYFFGLPPNDTEGDAWYELNFDDSGWLTGTAILGATNGQTYTPTVTTEIGSDIELNAFYADLWEHGTDSAGAPNDFTSGILNQTANTYGLGAGDDGWDASSGTFDYGSSVSFVGISSGRLRINSQDNTNDVSGAYAIEFTITKEMVDAMNSSEGVGSVSFDFWWDDTGQFESSDHVWVKAQWISPYSGTHYLGSDLDSSMSNNDATLEIYTDEDPDGDANQVSYSQSIKGWVEGEGNYYLVLGGKLLRNNFNEDGHWEFDNIQVYAASSRLGIAFADLWEHGTDNEGVPNDFSSGTLNQTANTYGLGAGNDGWDTSSATYDFTGTVAFTPISNGMLEIDIPDNSNDISGAFGIEVNVTQEMAEILSHNGIATLSFDYNWNDQGSFESTDHVWIKAQWISPTSGTHYLGSDLDSTMSDSDATLEIYTDEDPDGDTGTVSYSQAITPWIEGEGMYYLTFGVKLLRNNFNEEGEASFDNVKLQFSNLSNHYYFRKSFTLNNVTDIGKGILNVLSDDGATVYLNGNLINQDDQTHLAEYWNQRGSTIEGSLFRVGTNVIAVDMVNTEGAAKFDLELRAMNDSRAKAMMVMTDGVATITCAEQGTGSSTQDAVQAACDAREDFGITVYAVGYSDDADETTLSDIAQCGGGVFEKSDNSSALQDFYADVASSIVSASRHSQTIEVESGDNLLQSNLYPDSYIEINYTPTLPEAQFNEIALSFTHDNITNCTFTVDIPSQVRVTDAVVTSYSSEHWTDVLTVNNQVAYNLSVFSTVYTTLGDPFIVNVPISQLTAGTNTFTIRTGDIPENSTGCSLNNSFLYTGMISPAASYSSVEETADGCTWTIETEQLINISAAVPSDHSAGDECAYTSVNISFDPSDSTDSAVSQLLANLDFDGDGRVDVNIDQEDLQIEALYVSQVPSLWGPSIAEIQVWE